VGSRREGTLHRRVFGKILPCAGNAGSRCTSDSPSLRAPYLVIASVGEAISVCTPMPQTQIATSSAFVAQGYFGGLLATTRRGGSPETHFPGYDARRATFTRRTCRHSRGGGLPKTFGGAEEERELVVVAVLCYALVRK
jgi:hypothetical protein